MTELTPELLLRGYAIGVFPMAESRDDEELFFVEPKRRGIIPLDKFHVAKRLRRRVRSGVFDVRINAAFDDVVDACAAPRRGSPDSWINTRIRDLYQSLHHLGHAHSIECWREDRLVGGLYGVALGGAFFGESMFSRETDASKVALVHLVARMLQQDFQLLDTQFVTDHLRQFGAIEVSREEYRDALEAARHIRCDFAPETPLRDEFLARALGD